ncbi:MAG: 50S ribosomal protein L6, partial [Clostridiales bacterium]
MSRIGRMPIQVPAGVEVSIDGSAVEVKGPKGVLKRNFSPKMNIEQQNGAIIVSRN